MPDEGGEQGTGQGSQQPPPAAAGSASSGEGEDTEGLKRALRSEREARRAFEKQVNELSAWKQQQEDAQKTEAQKSAEKIAQYERERQTWETERRQMALEREISALNRRENLSLVDEEAAFRLLDHEAIDYDQSGHPRNLLHLLRELIKERPYLAGKPARGSADGGAGGQQQNGNMSLDDRLRTIAGYR